MLCIKDKCLEQKTRRVYISRDVVVDEQLFPFEDLRENTGAKLRQEISLISLALLPSYNMFQGEQISVPQGGSMQQGEEGIQVTLGAPSISVGDSVLIIGAKVQADPLATAAKESAPTTT
jgi:hypothetical protein